jgi:hypothetical protein
LFFIDAAAKKEDSSKSFDGIEVIVFNTKMNLFHWQKNKRENLERGPQCLSLLRSISKNGYKCETFRCAERNDSSRKEYLNRQSPG